MRPACAKLGVEEQHTARELERVLVSRVVTTAAHLCTIRAQAELPAREIESWSQASSAHLVLELAGERRVLADLGELLVAPSLLSLVLELSLAHALHAVLYGGQETVSVVQYTGICVRTISSSVIVKEVATVQSAMLLLSRLLSCSSPSSICTSESSAAAAFRGVPQNELPGVIVLVSNDDVPDELGALRMLLGRALIGCCCCCCCIAVVEGLVAALATLARDLDDAREEVADVGAGGASCALAKNGWAADCRGVLAFDGVGAGNGGVAVPTTERYWPGSDTGSETGGNVVLGSDASRIDLCSLCASRSSNGTTASA